MRVVVFIRLDYVVKDSDNYIAIDAGMNADVIVKEFGKLSINPDKVVAVFLTHTDRDHVGALAVFKQAKVYFSKQEEDMITGKKSKFLFMGNKISRKDYTLLNDQQEVTITNTKIKGILTPGHTSGSMCYVVNGKYLFTGDALALKDGKIATFNKFFNMDTEMAIKSISNIANLSNIAYIFTAHHGCCNDYENAVKDWKK